MTLSGRCQCGAVTWEAGTAPNSVHHCHCGMCRRWTGGGFATLVWFDRDVLRWHGQPVQYRSSPIAVRSHCGVCGTPLALDYDGKDEVAVTAGSLDDPDAVTPQYQYGVEGRLAWVDVGPGLPAETTQERW